jgi:hypothetical protein
LSAAVLSYINSINHWVILEVVKVVVGEFVGRTVWVMIGKGVGDTVKEAVGAMPGKAVGDFVEEAEGNIVSEGEIFFGLHPMAVCSRTIVKKIVRTFFRSLLHEKIVDQDGECFERIGFPP